MAFSLVSSLVAASLMLGPTGVPPVGTKLVTPAQMLLPEDEPGFAPEYAPRRLRRMAPEFAPDFAPDFDQGEIARPRRSQQREIEQSGRGSCSGAVDQAMAMTGGELLSVKPSRGQGVCVVTMLVIKSNGRPKKVRLRIPMDY